MSATNTFEAQLAALIFQNADAAGIGDATGLRGSSAAGSLFVALFTADPGEAGATTNETTYTSYARVAVVRSAAGFTVSGSAPTTVSNAAVVSFPVCTGGSSTVTHFAIMTAITGGTMLLKGALLSSLAVSNLITPNFAIGALTATID